MEKGFAEKKKKLLFQCKNWQTAKNRKKKNIVLNFNLEMRGAHKKTAKKTSIPINFLEG